MEVEQVPDSNEDFRFMSMLLAARALPRRKGVFSPSMLSSCLRQSWFAKRGTEKHAAFSVETNGYFLKGNFVHLQWQFACWRLHQARLIELVTVPIAHELDILRELFLSGDENHSDRDYVQWSDALDFNGDGTRLGVEVRVVDGDFGGTIDVLARFLLEQREPVRVVDFKGINLIDFQRTLKNGTKSEYKRQISGYGKIASTVLGLDVREACLVSECKAGPLRGRTSPLALHEDVIQVVDHLGDVKRLLKTLRHYDAVDDMPPAECVSTRHKGYEECAFNRYCKDEVLVAQRAREAMARTKARMREVKPKLGRG